VLLKIKTCGICGSDARSYFTGTEKRYKIPIILGHELSAEVYETGSKVKDYCPGERVVVAPIYGCGKCEFCTSGKENICKDVVVFGCTYDGGFAEFMLIPEKGVERGVLVKIPKEITDAEGTMIEPLSCCLHGLRRLDIQPGDSVAIFGAGPIGISHMIIAKKLGAGKMAIIDMVKSRLEGALNFGADAIFNIEEKEWKDQIFDYFGSKGVDAIITAAPSVKAAEIGYRIVKNGGKMLIFGGLPHGSVWTMDPNILHYNEITITGSIDATIDDFRRATSMAPHLDLKRFITHTLSLDEVKEGMEIIKKKEGLKVILDMAP
jgi:L-iditol 2-dehydrogenase